MPKTFGVSLLVPHLLFHTISLLKFSPSHLLLSLPSSSLLIFSFNFPSPYINPLEKLGGGGCTNRKVRA